MNHTAPKQKTATRTLQVHGLVRRDVQNPALAAVEVTVAASADRIMGDINKALQAMDCSQIMMVSSIVLRVPFSLFTSIIAGSYQLNDFRELLVFCYVADHS